MGCCCPARLNGCRMSTDQEFLRIERAVRKAVTAILEREVPVTVAVRAAAVALLQGDADPAATSPHPQKGLRSAVRG